MSSPEPIVRGLINRFVAGLTPPCARSPLLLHPDNRRLRGDAARFIGTSLVAESVKPVGFTFPHRRERAFIWQSLPCR